MIQKYIEEIKRQSSTGLAWLDEARRASVARLEKTGFPSQRLEEWKDTNLSPITNTYFQPSTKTYDQLSSQNAIWENRPHVIFNNGFCEIINVQAEGVTVQKIGEAFKTLPDAAKKLFETKPRYEHAIMDLNTSVVKEGVVVQIQKNTMVEQPIYLVYQSTASEQVHHYRNMILAEANTKVKVVEIFQTQNDSWTVPVTQIHTSANANVEHIVIQNAAMTSNHTGVIIGRMQEHSRLATYSFAFGGKIVRNDIHMVLDGEGAECVMDGLYAASENQLMDHHTVVEHNKPHCNSFENYKGVLMDQAHGVFEGKIVVAQDAQKTDAKQMNQNLLLSSAAKVNAAPQLEILADDVKCAHGATIGKLDEDQVFYLRSRGIDSHTAKQMLVSAYAGEVIAGISIPELQEELHRNLSQKIGSI